MRYAGAGFEHQTNDATNRDVQTHACLVYQRECAVKHIEPSLFKK
jgi:hypothetical protein